MTTHTYMRSLALCTSTFFVLWLLIVFFASPVELGVIAYILFYVIFFLLITGVAGLAFMYLFTRAQKNKVIIAPIGTTLRQGSLIGVLLTTTLLFQQFGIFAWWVGLLIFSAVLVIELYFLSRSK